MARDFRKREDPFEGVWSQLQPRLFFKHFGKFSVHNSINYSACKIGQFLGAVSENMIEFLEIHLKVFYDQCLKVSCFGFHGVKFLRADSKIDHPLTEFFLFFPQPSGYHSELSRSTDGTGK